MKTKILQIAALLLMIATGFSCGKDEPVELEGTSWELAGIVDVKTGKQRDLSPKGGPHIFYFTSDSTASEVDRDVNPAHLVLSPKTYIYISPSADILIVDEFYDVINGVSSYEFKRGKELRLFYNSNKNYLLYKLL